MLSSFPETPGSQSFMFWGKKSEKKDTHLYISVAQLVPEILLGRLQSSYRETEDLKKKNMDLKHPNSVSEKKEKKIVPP